MVGLRDLTPSKLSKVEKWNMSYELFAWVAYQSEDKAYSEFLQIYSHTEEGRAIVDLLHRLRGPAERRNWSLSPEQAATLDDFKAGHNVCTLGAPGTGKVTHTPHTRKDGVSAATPTHVHQHT